MPSIFVSYRRDNSAAMAGWIHQNLVTRYGQTSVFRDIDTIDPGTNFRAAIARGLRTTDVVVAVIGKKWCAATNGGQARISEDKDWIRLEMEIALQLGITIIPVLVDDANMPTAAELPESLRELPYINALRCDAGANFETQVTRLMGLIDRVAQTTTLQPPPRPIGTAPGPAPAHASVPPSPPRPAPTATPGAGSNALPGTGSAAMAGVAATAGNMFRDLMNFSFQRTPLQAFGWYLIFFVIGVAIGAVIGGLIGGATGNGAAVGIIAIMATVLYHLVLGILLIKDRHKDALNIILVIVSVVLSMFLGALGGLICLAVLTTRPLLDK